MINPAKFDPWPALRQHIAKPAKAPAAEIDDEAIIDAALSPRTYSAPDLPVPTAPQPREQMDSHATVPEDRTRYAVFVTTACPLRLCTMTLSELPRYSSITCRMPSQVSDP
jgi:hypothetical protein